MVSGCLTIIAILLGIVLLMWLLNIAFYVFAPVAVIIGFLVAFRLLVDGWSRTFNARSGAKIEKIVEGMCQDSIADLIDIHTRLGYEIHTAGLSRTDDDDPADREEYLSLVRVMREEVLSAQRLLEAASTLEHRTKALERAETVRLEARQLLDGI